MSEGPMYYDAKAGAWVSQPPAWWAERRAALGRGQGHKPVLQLSSGAVEQVEAPCEYVDLSEMVIEPTRKAESAYTYKPPYESISRYKFPKTWGWMVQFYYSSDYHSSTRYVSEYKTDHKTGGYTPSEYKGYHDV